jgi:hypothetical protein
MSQPHLILPAWEIMQQAGKQAISLHPNILFSRTTSDVDPLPPIKPSNSLNILLVIGEKQIKTAASSLNLTAINTGGETNPDQALESEPPISSGPFPQWFPPELGSESQSRYLNSTETKN